MTTTCASELMSATLVPGRNCRKCAASMCGVRTRSILRGSAMINLVPARRRRFMREANTGWASVGLAPIKRMTSAYSTDLKSCVPAEVPNAFFKPNPVGEWHTRAHVSTLLLPNAARTIFCTANTSSFVQRDEVMPPIEFSPYVVWMPLSLFAAKAIASSHDTVRHSWSMESRTIGSSWRSGWLA